MIERKQLHPSIIRTDGGTQMRAELDPTTITEYAQAIQDGATFPPLIVFYDGETYWLGDGFHRLAARKKLMEGAIFCEVRAGTRRDAVLCAACANATHGRRRTNADKRRAVEALLRDQEWGQWSDREIAKACCVDHKTVGNLRRELSGEIPQIAIERNVQRNGQTYTMHTTNIATANQDRKEQRQAPAPTPPSYPSPSSHPSHNEAHRLLTTPETVAVIWRAIQHSGHPTPAEQLTWLTNSTGADFRKLLNPGVNFADTIFLDAFNAVKENLRRQVETAPARSSIVATPPAKPVEAWAERAQSEPIPLTYQETRKLIIEQLNHHADPAEKRRYLHEMTYWRDWLEFVPAGRTLVKETHSHVWRDLIKVIHAELGLDDLGRPLVDVATAPAPIAPVTTEDTPDEKPDSDEYYTPPYIAEAARQVLGAIDLDPASSPLAQTVINATRYYTKEEDGLTKPWTGKLWLNPPYSRPAPFVAKLIAEYEAGAVEAAIALLNNGTETQWGQALLARYPVCFVGAHGDRGSRISFWKKSPDEPKGGNRYAQMIVYLGNATDQFIATFAQFGVILTVAVPFAPFVAADSDD